MEVIGKKNRHFQPMLGISRLWGLVEAGMLKAGLSVDPTPSALPSRPFFTLHPCRFATAASLFQFPPSDQNFPLEIPDSLTYHS